MRIRTLAGDVIDLRFVWLPTEMHRGRQAARLYAERMTHVVIMRSDESRAAGWETQISNDVSDDGATRTVRYAIVASITDAERAIPEGELFVRDKLEPMVNVLGNQTVIDFAPGGAAATAIVARFQAAITAALNNEHT